MTQILYAKEKDSDYENFYATCPYCGFKNIFNRVSDLATTDPISFITVKCLNKECTKDFNINGDSVNAAYEIFVYDCYGLIQEKKYSYCILNLVKAYESFFVLFIKIWLIFNPFNREDDSVEDANSALRELYDVTKKCTFYPMRNIFFNLVINEVVPKSISNSQEVIRDLPNMGSNLPENEFNKIKDKKLKAVLLKIESTKLSALRDNVIHKMAYRPSLDEVERALEETRNNIFSVSRLLGVNGDDANWYLTASG